MERDLSLYKLLCQLDENNYYFKYWKKKEITPRNIKQYYEKLSITSRSDILSNIDTVIHPSIREHDFAEGTYKDALNNLSALDHDHRRYINTKYGKYRIEVTTGTTGRPFPVIKSENVILKESLQLFHMRRKIDSRVNHSNGCFLIHQADPNIKQMNLWIPTSKDFLSIYQYLEQNRYLWVFTGAQFIKNFANYMKKNNLCLNYPLSFIEYSSQNILPEDKIVIENVFNTRLISNYACREVWSIAYECRCGHLHVNDKYLILDIVDDKDNIITEENRFGRVIITSTINTTMPLIKYSIGDIARINYNFKCECGNLSPIIELAPGRESDLIDGTNIYGNSLFRRVMRRIYFHEDLTIKNVRIVYQKLTRKFNVYVELENVKHALEVKKKFLEHTFEISPELRRYKFEFKYEFPFHSIPSAEKEQIFFKE